MADDNKPNKEDMNSLLNSKAKWSKASFYSCLAASLIALAACLIFILFLYTGVSSSLFFGVFITLIILGFAAVVVMIISWYSVRRLDKEILKLKNDFINTSDETDIHIL